MSTSREVREGYISTLADLTCNSKPLINVLTILADENIEHAADIVATIESHLEKVRKDIKLPVLYLIDCIMKNVGGTYLTLFSQNIITTFCHVFEVVDEKTRAEMFKLRQTWNDVLPKSKLYSLDVKVNQIDPAWPIVMPPVTNNIHLNPKFLQNTALPKKSPPITLPAPDLPQPILAPDSGLTTLDMQKKLLMKQQQLLELQQKRLELEVLQTKVKLQERMTMGNGTPGSEAVNVPKPQNILLKPEVAKQLTGATNSTKNKQVSSSSIMNKRLPQNQSGGGAMGAPSARITPANSALVAAATAGRPTRDPRLTRHQNAAAASANNNSTVSSSNVQIENKSNITTETLGSNANKSFNNNKASVQGNSRSDPRSQVSSKSSATSPNQTKSKTLTQSPSKKTSSSSTASKEKPDKSDKSDLFSVKAGRSSRTAPKSTGSTSSKGSTSSLDSPSKGKSGKGDSKAGRSASASPVKHKKKDTDKVSEKLSRKILGEKISKASSGAPTSSSSSSSSINNFGKGDKESKLVSPGKQQGDGSSPTFKEFKPSAKSRNYIRRNRDVSVSPEPVQDVDLRLSGPPEKQPRLQTEISDDKGSTYDINVTGMDVDLRQLPAMVSKKRSSTDTTDTGMVAKKTKTEVFDELFGNEDTDLRQLTGVMTSPPTQDRPPTPPPPIISSKTEDEQKSEKIKNLDILRAKLANATSRDKIRSKQEQKQKEDTDLRSSNGIEESMNRIIISSADEQCIKTGNMTKEQEKALMNKILAQMENQKLNEAKRKDNEENLGNISLQPISDDELEADFSGSSDEETAAFRRNVYVDKDDRVPSTTQINNEYNNKYPRAIDRGDLRRGLWRGRPLRSRGMIRGGIRNVRPGDAWGRPMNGPWKPMQSNFMKPPMYNNEIIDLDRIEQEQGSESTSQELVVDFVNQDNTKSINIDGYPREIRYYDETAIIFMSWDDPREISFQNGSRKITFGDKDIYILSFNEPYKEVLINGSPHNVKLGAPTREIYVDGKYYECFFGGPQVFIDLDGKLTSLKMEGPPPQVKIGTNVRRDLVAGKINLIIDAKSVVPVFLDGKVQKFEFEGKTNTLKFVDALKTVLINDVSFGVEYGGLPKPILLQEKKHFIRFARLPRGVHPGLVKIKDMEGNAPDSPRHDSENSLDTFPVVDPNEPALPVLSRRRKHLGHESPERNSNSPVPSLFQQSGLNNLDNMLSTVMASNLLPTNTNVSTSNGYQVENQQQVESQQKTPQHDVQNVPQAAAPPPVLPSSWNINDLFQKLVASGIMTTLQEQKHTIDSNVQKAATKSTNISGGSSGNNNNNNTGSNVPVMQKFPIIFGKKELPVFYKAVSFDKPETLKIRQSTLTHALYSGMPCSSCGMRFPPEQSMQYSQHLDWHFRQNRKGKKNIRKAASRRWYYSLSDWKNYEEIEDLEEREKSYFENQQQAQADGADEAEEEMEIPSVPADPSVQDPRCEVCHDRFDQFYNEEKEEWHLKQAVCVDGLNYHPLCYEDYQSSLVETTLEDSAVEKDDDNTQDSVIPGLDAVLVEKNDENTSEIVIDDDESEKLTEVSETAKELDKEEITQSGFPEEDDGEDDDVIINEVVPEKIDLVDDDKYDDLPESNDSESKVFQIKEEPIDDGFMDVDGGIFKVRDIDSVKIKSEPIDPDELIGEETPMVAQDVERPEGKPEAHPTDLVTYIDGNVEFDSNVQPTSGISGKIKINITKPLPVIPPKESSTNKELSSEIERGGESIDPSQPLPPGEEPVQLNIKPALQGVNLKKLPPVKKGSELSGLCSIM